MGKKVNQTELAEIIGVTDVTVWQWQKDGLPIEQVNTRGLSNVYDTAEVHRWLVQRAEKKVRDESPRDALARAQTKLIEVSLAEKSRELVPLAEIEPRFARMVVGARQRILQVLVLMRGVLEPAQLRALEQHMHEALEELSRYEPSNATSTEAPDGAVAPAEEAGGGGLVGSEEGAERQEPVSGTVQAVDHPVPSGTA